MSNVKQEPIAWLSQCIKGPSTGCVEMCDGPDDVSNFEYWTPAFPVYRNMVVLPERVVQPEEDYSGPVWTNEGECMEAIGWNKCLDKIEETIK